MHPTRYTTAVAQPHLEQPLTAAPLVPVHTASGVVLVPAAAPNAPYVQQPAAAPVAAGRDPWPARLLCGGVGIGAAGLGLGFAMQAIAAATTGLALLVGVLALVWLLRSGSGRSGSVSVSVTQKMGGRR
jgi:hypothetical protein